MTVVRDSASSTGAAATGQQRRFLPEVQALRAVAVLLVVAYHLRPDLVPGGFVGVDVFFVISGFLITGHMIREVRDTGRLRLAHFWANRARRILPAALLLILFVVATATFVIPITEWGNVGRQALGSIFYVENWLLAADSVDYSASDNAATPFQHFWSLAVEEQFYLLWPLIVVAAAWVAGRLARRRRAEEERRPRIGLWLLIAFSTLVGASFAWSVLQVSAGDPSAYFVTTTRLWELGVGGILAVVLRYTDRWAGLRSLLALAGLAVIGVGSFALTGSSPFPGVNALLPVLGSAAVIAAGRTSGFGSLTRVVDTAGAQWIGNVSYSLYLWHFPIAIYFTVDRGRQPTILEGIGLIGVMLVGSALSYYLVEQPIRTAGWARRSDRRALIAAGMAMVLVAGSTTAFWITPQQQQSDWDQAAEEAKNQGQQKGLLGAAAPREGIYRPFVGPEKVITPNPLTAEKQEEFLETSGRCGPKRTDKNPRQCEFGDPNADVVVAVVGDSHARMFTPPVLQAAEEHGWRVVTFIRNSCPYSQTPRTIPDGKDCVAANATTAKRLARLDPDVVVASSYAGSRFVGGKSAAIDGFASAWQGLVEQGARVVVIKDAPQPAEDVVACVAENYDSPQKCSVERSKGLDGRGIVDPAAKRVSGVELVDLTDLFCTPDKCYPVLGGVLVYRDTNHVGQTYAESLTPEIGQALVDAVKQHA